jgi:GAF domain-containing protein/HAMP domain-containing protein
MEAQQMSNRLLKFLSRLRLSRFSLQELNSRLENKAVNSFWICVCVTLVSLIGASFYTYLYFSLGHWQFLVLAGLILSLAIASIIGVFLARIGRPVLGIWILLLVGQLAVAISTIFVGGQGMWYASGVILSTLLISSLTMTSSQSLRAVAIGVFAALSSLIVDDFFKAWQTATPPMLSYFIVGVVIFLLILYTFVLAVFFGNYTFRSKITIVVFGAALISILILATVNSQIYRSTLLRNADQTLLIAADRTAVEIDSYLARRVSELEQLNIKSPTGSDILSTFLTLTAQERALSSDVADQLKASKESLGAVELILLDRRGTVTLHTTYSNVIGFAPYHGLSDYDKGLIDSSILGGAPFISSILFPTGSQLVYFSEPYFYIGVRIIDREGNPLGLVMGAYQIGEIQNIVQANVGLAGDQSFGELLDDNYMRIIHSGYPEANYKLVYPVDNETFKRLQHEHRIPFQRSELITTNFSDYKTGLDQLYATPFFETNEIGINNESGLAAGVRLDQKNWTLVFMQPRSAVLGPIALQTRTTVLISGLVGVIAVVASALLAQLITRPVVQLTKAAEKASAGDLSIRASVSSGDEIGKLSTAFNSMIDQLSSMLQSLEERVRERTNALFLSTEQLEYRASRLQMVAEIAHTYSEVTDPDQLLTLVVNSISEKFGFYHVGLFRVDKYGEYAILAASNSEGGQRMLARGHRLRVGEEGLVGYVTHFGEARIALDVGADAVFFNNPDLPETRSEITLPLKRGTRIIGALDVQSTMPKAFDSSDIALLSTLADQVTMSIENARLINDARRTVRELELAQRQYIQQEWGKVRAEIPQEGYDYNLGRLAPISSPTEESVLNNLSNTPTVIYESSEGNGNRQELGLMIPILLRGQPIGIIELNDPDAPRRWGQEEISLAASVADQVGLALENARLLETTQRRAERERLVSDITTKLRATNDPQQILETAVSQLKTALKVRSVQVRVATNTVKDESDSAYS